MPGVPVLGAAAAASAPVEPLRSFQESRSNIKMRLRPSPLAVAELASGPRLVRGPGLDLKAALLELHGLGNVDAPVVGGSAVTEAE